MLLRAPSGEDVDREDVDLLKITCEVLILAQFLLKAEHPCHTMPNKNTLSPRSSGFMIQFDLRIFFKWVAQPPATNILTLPS